MTTVSNMCPRDLVPAHSYPSGHILPSPPDYLELKADLQLCHKHQGKPPRATAYSRSTPGNRFTPLNHPVVSDPTRCLGGAGERGKWSVLPHAKHKLLPWLKKLSEFFQSGLYNAVTLCKEGGWSVPRMLASWHCHPQGTTNAGPLGKLQFGLTQHCHKTSACPILQPKPC